MSKGIRVPAQLWLPSPLASDGFGTVGNTTDGQGTSEANGGAGLVWTGATWTVSGGAVSNAPTQGADALTNGNMETGDPPSSWTALGSPTLDGVADERTGGAGSQSLDGVRGSQNVSMYQAVTLSTGTWYSLSGWLKKIATSQVGAGAGTTNNGLQYTPNNYTPGTSWASFTNSFRATQTSGFVSLALDTAAGEGRWDDISLKPLTLSTLFRSLQLSTADVVADVAITRTAGTQAGLVLNLNDAVNPTDFIIVYENGAGSVVVDECIAGVYTNKATTAVTYSAGAVLRVITDGTSLRVFYNNLAVGTVLTMTANTNKLCGLFDTYGNVFDNFVVWARGTSGEYESLNQF